MHDIVCNGPKFIIVWWHSSSSSSIKIIGIIILLCMQQMLNSIMKSITNTQSKSMEKEKRVMVLGTITTH